MAIRYVIDPAVARDLLAREPHLRSVIHPEEYKLPDEIRSPEQLTKALTGAVEGQSMVPGSLYVTSIQQRAFDVQRPPGISPHWEATYTVYGVLG